ncbi:hypothetical protein BA895_15670 [Humibacillus sp. DSM 29435]|uniref:DUF1800 domain-containing protein n=1 Tax=Humibacillus sp. DSM 29435 TaxID=1869167 RepID=UPI0008724290|nr:DUF1800 domain-containing protein [Humibacillus sp. DSM 29435]OFE17452.1 hypothetical protein BA895_15670 [Humibacillus sp. DSM 29435]
MTSTSWAQSAHLVRSTGFGGSGALVDVVDKQGAAAWVQQSLHADASHDPTVTATPAPTFDTLPPLGKGASREERQKRRQADREQVNELLAWWIRRMATAANPMVEKLTFGWHNHFSTSASKVRSASMLLGQNETLRALGRGSFLDLAEAMVKDPAMLVWLDGQKNTATAPNENLAREFMELFTLGHGGGYTETDVKEGARALTGWTVSRLDGTARFMARRHDSQAKTLLGTTADLDATGFVRVVLGHNASAPFVVGRWWRLLAGPGGPPPDALARIVAAYGPGRDLRAMFGALFTDPALVSAAGSVVVSPVEWVVGSMRALSLTADDATVRRAAAMMRSLGQVPLHPPNVSGWPSGQAWLSTAAATTRVRAATTLVRAADLHAVEDQPASARVEAVAHLLGIPTLSGRTAAELKKHVGLPPRLVATALVCPENLVI